MVGIPVCRVKPSRGVSGLGTRDEGSRRWTTKDPILFAGGDTSLSDMSRAIPIKLPDPSGTDAWDSGRLVSRLCKGLVTDDDI